MPESRDRLARAVDIAALYARRRSGPVEIFQDQPELDAALFGTPRPRPITAAPQRLRTGTVGAGSAGRGRGGLGTPRGRSMYGTPATTRSRENLPGGSARRGNGHGRARGANSVLPYWYPRTPLRDITAVVRAIERRRERLRGSEGQENESPIPQAHRVTDSSGPSADDHLEHSDAITTPVPSHGTKRCPPTIGKVPRILLDITNQSSGDSECLTPQKKLLNSIDKVEKVVMEELQKLKRTPTARKVEREKRVRTLMSMR